MSKGLGFRGLGFWGLGWHQAKPNGLHRNNSCSPCTGYLGSSLHSESVTFTGLFRDFIRLEAGKSAVQAFQDCRDVVLRTQ